jgi:hypothetical protein
MQLFWLLAWPSLVGVAVARDQRQALATSVEPDPDQHPPDAVLRDANPTPLFPGRLGRDPPRTEAGMAERKGDHPLLQVRADLVRHPRPRALPDPQRLQPPSDRPSASSGNRSSGAPPSADTPGAPRSPRQREQPQAVAEQHVIMRHAPLLQVRVCLGRRCSLKERADAPASWPGRPTSSLYRRPQRCRHNSGLVRVRAPTDMS